ncbi:MAG: diguanylate cyclase [Clostridia bacterium]
MNYNEISIPSAALFVMITAYWYGVFELINHLLKKPKLTRPYRLLVSVFNTVFIFAAYALVKNSSIPYLLVILVLLIEFQIFYKDTFLRNLFCVTACVIHVLVIRAIVTGAFSLISGLSIYEITNNSVCFVYSALITFTLVNTAIALVVKLLPLDQVRIVNEHIDQQFFMVGWMSISIAYLLLNSAAAEIDTFHLGMVVNQIAAPCMIMLGTYIMLFFAFRMGELLGYKEKNAELTLTVSKEQEYRTSIAKDAILTYEFNATQGLLISGFEAIKPQLGEITDRYDDMLSDLSQKLIHPDDRARFASFASRAVLTEAFEQGKSEITLEYRQLLSTGKYIWCQAVTNLARDTENGDIRGFVIVKDIDKSKCRQIKLQYEAERDSLTGLYNKGLTTQLITEHLSNNHTKAASALFMIDMDKFKNINDHFGHAYGDAVLCEHSQKLLRIFSAGSIVGRIGGDEYIAYIKEGATDALVREKGNEICKAFHTIYHDASGQEFTLSSSVGVAVCPKDGTTFEELYEHADTALYLAKKHGKNNCQSYCGGDFCGYQSERDS